MHIYEGYLCLHGLYKYWLPPPEDSSYVSELICSTVHAPASAIGYMLLGLCMSDYIVVYCRGPLHYLKFIGVK